MSINIDKGVYLCHRCGLKGRLSGTANCTSPLSPAPSLDEKKHAAIERRWRQSLSISREDPVYRYLLCRGLISNEVSDIPITLRYHPRLPYQHDDGRWTHHPAIVALVQAPGGEVVTLHRTYLTLDGRKADVASPKKLMACYLPYSMKGAAIRLYPAAETLALTEGIETALAVRHCTGLPVWATVSASGLSKVQLPDKVKTAIICADHDTPGIENGQKLATRLYRERRKVKLLYPDTPGLDWADGMRANHAG